MNEKAIKTSLAYQALARIKTIYRIEGTLSDLSPEERLREQQKSIKPLVDEYFTWKKERLANTSVLPKEKNSGRSELQCHPGKISPGFPH